MVKFLGVLSILLLVSCGFQSHAGDENNQKNMKQYKSLSGNKGQYAPDELLIKFSDDVPETMAKNRIREKGASLLSFIKQQGVYHIRLPKGQSAKDEIAAYKKIKGIDFVEFNYIRGFQ